MSYDKIPWPVWVIVTLAVAAITAYATIVSRDARRDIAVPAAGSPSSPPNGSGGPRTAIVNAKFTQCRQSIEEAVNSGAWPQAQKIGIDCAARLDLGKSDEHFADLTFWLGRAYEGGGQLPEALDSFNQAYRTAVELGNDRMAVDNLLGKARVLRSLARPNDARACLGEVLSRAERLAPLERETYRAAARKELATF